MVDEKVCDELTKIVDHLTEMDSTIREQADNAFNNGDIETYTYCQFKLDMIGYFLALLDKFFERLSEKREKE